MFGNLLKTADLMLKWKKNKNEKHDRIFEYVSHIADDAEDLAKVWTMILSKLLEAEEVQLEKNPIISDFIYRPKDWEYSNMPSYSRIEYFYNRLHYVLGDYDIEKADLLLDKLAKLMETRNLSREEIKTGLKMDGWDRKKILSLIEQINQQASEIRGFAIEVKAKN